ncbi:MAG: Crp/Fnr family transcriptional regulator [Bacteroidota bacterium]
MDLKETVTKFTGLPAAAVDRLLALGTTKELSKGDLFIRAGDLPKKMGLVLSGLFRYVYTDDNGNEFTKAFMPAASFLSSYSSMIHGERSYYGIEALEDARVLEFSYEHWQQLRTEDPAWDKLLLKMLELGYSAKERRERELLLLSAEERYQNFYVRYPDLAGRIKQRQIASFLGIQPESLSRIKKKLGP